MILNNVVILNKLHRKDSITGLDVYYKHYIPNVEYKQEKVTSVVDKTVSMGQTFTILIPFDDNYLPYSQWKDSPDNHFTIQQGDLIFLCEKVDDIINVNNAQSIRVKYEPNVCEIRSIVEVPYRRGVKYQFKLGGI